MHRTASLLLLLASTSSLHSQIQVSSCPITLYAQRQSQLTLRSASEAAGQDQSQGLHVILTRTDTPAIASVEATLHGLSPDGRVLPVTVTPARDITKTFRLERRSGEESLTAFDLWMNRVGSLRWVDITSITYTDGTTWHTPRPSLCRAIPSLFTLVAAAP